MHAVYHCIVAAQPATYSHVVALNYSDHRVNLSASTWLSVTNVCFGCRPIRHWSLLARGWSTLWQGCSSWKTGLITEFLQWVTCRLILQTVS